jgi:hypothetical protein
MYVSVFVFILSVICLTGNCEEIVASSPKRKAIWGAKKIVSFMLKKGSRAYFSRLFKNGGFRTGMEVGTAQNRFSELFLADNPMTLHEWHMVEPYPDKEFWERSRGWHNRGIGVNTRIIHHQTTSTNVSFIDSLGEQSLDFIYLDGAHDYDTVRHELPLYWEKVKVGGILAGHDYSDHGETKKLECRGCEVVPRSVPYTEYGIERGKGSGLAQTQTGVVRAVQEWLVSVKSSPRVHYTNESFTRDSLEIDKFDYDLVITSTRNPSWYVIKMNS